MGVEDWQDTEKLEPTLVCLTLHTLLISSDLMDPSKAPWLGIINLE